MLGKLVDEVKFSGLSNHQGQPADSGLNTDNFGISCTLASI